MLEKSLENFSKKPENAFQQGNVRFYVLKNLLLQEVPVTVTELRKIINADGLLFSNGAIRVALSEIRNILPELGMSTTEVAAGDSRAAAYFLTAKISVCPLEKI